MTVFVGEHLDELLAELHEDSNEAAGAVNRACRVLEAAYQERQAVEQNVTALAGMVRVPRPGDVQRTRAEAVVREANRLLAEGGEAPARLTVDPRAPARRDSRATGGLMDFDAIAADKAEREARLIEALTATPADATASARERVGAENSVARCGGWRGRVGGEGLSL
jgi:hypothetical protein